MMGITNTGTFLLLVMHGAIRRPLVQLSHKHELQTWAREYSAKGLKKSSFLQLDKVIGIINYSLVNEMKMKYWLQPSTNHHSKRFLASTLNECRAIYYSDKRLINVTFQR